MTESEKRESDIKTAKIARDLLAPDIHEPGARIMRQLFAFGLSKVAQGEKLPREVKIV